MGVERYQLDYKVIPDCWPEHGVLVELSALRTFERLLPARIGCVGTHHLPPRTRRRVASTPRVELKVRSYEDSASRQPTLQQRGQRCRADELHIRTRHLASSSNGSFKSV
jgi:hypothetical protein